MIQLSKIKIDIEPEPKLIIFTISKKPKMQIDVKFINIDTNIVTCNLYTGERCVTIYMSVFDYEILIYDKFFIRDGKERYSANVLNTTDNYLKQE